MTTATQHPESVRIARWIGGMLLVMAISAIFAEFVGRASLMVPGDAAATLSNILSAQTQFRAGLFGYLLAFTLDVPVAVLLYVLFRHVNRLLALNMLAFRLVFAAVVMAALLAYLGAVLLLGGGDHGFTFDVATQGSLAYFLLVLFQHSFNLALAIFGVHLALLGVLLWESRMVPRWLSALVGVGGLGYVIDNVLVFLAPDVRATLAPVFLTLGMSELLLALWFVVRGVKVENTTP